MYPANSSHMSLTTEDQRKIGISEGLVSLSVHKDSEDIVADSEELSKRFNLTISGLENIWVHEIFFSKCSFPFVFLSRFFQFMGSLLNNQMRYHPIQFT